MLFLLYFSRLLQIKLDSSSQYHDLNVVTDLMFKHSLHNLKIFAFRIFSGLKERGEIITKEKLLECYVRFDSVVRVFLTSRCVLYSVVLTAWAGYGNTGTLVNRGGEILQGQTTISNIYENFSSLTCLTSFESYYSNSSRKTFLKTDAHCRTRTMRESRIHFSEFFCIKFKKKLFL